MCSKASYEARDDDGDDGDDYISNTSSPLV